MWKLTVNRIRARFGRFALTGVAVVAGVAFIMGTLVLTATMSDAFYGVAGAPYRDADAVVRSSVFVEDDMGSRVRGTLDERVVAEVSEIPGVAAAVAHVEGIAHPLTADGELVDDNPQKPAPIGMAWLGDTALNPLSLVEGTAPARPDDVVVDVETARSASLSVGDELRVLTTVGSPAYTVAGIATYDGKDDAAGAEVVAFAPAAADEILGRAGRIDAVHVTAGDGVSEAELTAAVGAQVATDTTEVVTASTAMQEARDDAQGQLQFFNMFLVTFAVIALVVGAFVISNTFSITVAQRGREHALLRAIGASGRQVRRSVLAESLLVGVSASAVGVVAGVGAATALRAMLGAFGIELPAGDIVVPTSAVVVSMVVGVVTTVLASYLPARRAAKIPAIAALRDVAIDRSAGSRRRAVIGGVVTALGTTALVAGLADADPGIVGLGAFAVFVGVAVLGPTLARPITRLLGAPIARARGVTGALARANAGRNPKRTSATAAALMVGVGLVVFITIFASSAKASFRAQVDTALDSDWIVETPYGQGGLDEHTTAAIDALAETGEISPVRYGAAVVDGQRASVGAFDTTRQGLFDFQVSEGSFADLDADTLAVSRRAADAEGWTVGTEVDLETPEAGARTVTVAAIYDVEQPLGPYALSLEGWAASFTDRSNLYLLVDTAEGVDQASARRAIEAQLADAPTATLSTQEQFSDSIAGQVDQTLNLVYAMLALALLIALFGIANTLALSIVERTRELGLLRAVGMARSQVRATVRWESVLIALLGTTLGGVIGFGFGWALVDAMHEAGVDHFSVPLRELGVVVVFAAAAAVLAALLPARRAARMDVLQALQHD